MRKLTKRRKIEKKLASVGIIGEDCENGEKIGIIKKMEKNLRKLTKWRKNWRKFRNWRKNWTKRKENWRKLRKQRKN